MTATRVATRGRWWVRISGTALLAGAGGFVGDALGIPAGWLCGAMIATAIAALATLPVVIPPLVRGASFVALGTSMGSTITPDTMREMGSWPLSLLLLLTSVATTMVASSAYLHHVRGWDAVTARFSSVPGALSSVLVLASTSRADFPRVALAQTLRQFVLVAGMPWAVAQGGSAAGLKSALVAAPGGAALMLSVGTAGGLLVQRLRMPGGLLIGAMIASGLVHATGTIGGRLPPAILAIAYIATGAVIGCRFQGTSVRVLVGTIMPALESILIAVLISAGFAGIATRILDLGFGEIWLAYAPGGVEAMTVMALALNLSPSFVGMHHVLRLLALNALSPLWMPARNKR